MGYAGSERSRDLHHNRTDVDSISRTGTDGERVLRHFQHDGLRACSWSFLGLGVSSDTVWLLGVRPCAWLVCASVFLRVAARHPIGGRFRMSGKGRVPGKHVSRARGNGSRLSWATATAILACVASALSALTALLVLLHLV